MNSYQRKRSGTASQPAAQRKSNREGEHASKSIPDNRSIASVQKTLLETGNTDKGPDIAQLEPFVPTLETIPEEESQEPAAEAVTEPATANAERALEESSEARTTGNETSEVAATEADTAKEQVATAEEPANKGKKNQVDKLDLAMGAGVVYAAGDLGATVTKGALAAKEAGTTKISELARQGLTGAAVEWKADTAKLNAKIADATEIVHEDLIAPVPVLDKIGNFLGGVGAGMIARALFALSTVKDKWKLYGEFRKAAEKKEPAAAKQSATAELFEAIKYGVSQAGRALFDACAQFAMAVVKAISKITAVVPLVGGIMTAVTTSYGLLRTAAFSLNWLKKYWKGTLGLKRTQSAETLYDSAKKGDASSLTILKTMQVGGESLIDSLINGAKITVRDREYESYKKWMLQGENRYSAEWFKRLEENKLYISKKDVIDNIKKGLKSHV